MIVVSFGGERKELAEEDQYFEEVLKGEVMVQEAAILPKSSMGKLLRRVLKDLGIYILTI